MLPASLMEQLASGRVRFRFNDELTHNDALARTERIRAGAIAAFHWLDAHTALRKALSSRPRPPTLEAIKEGTIVYVYEPPPSRRGLARRLQDNASWIGPGVAVCVERDHSVPRRLWIRIRGSVKAFPLEKVRLATPDEMTSSQFITDALKDVEAELTKGGITTVEEANPGQLELPPQAKGEASQPKRRKVIVDFEEVSDDQVATEADTESSEDEADAETRERRAKLLEDVPFSVQRTLAERRKREEEAAMDPHALEFAKKQRMFEALSKTFGEPTKLQEGELRNRMEQAYARVRSVRKVIRSKGKEEQQKKGRQAQGQGGARASQAATVEVLAAAGDVLVPYFKPGEFEALVNDTVGQWTLWTGASRWAGVSEIYEVSATLHRAEMEGVTEVVTGRARAEYQWSKLDEAWRQSFVDPLKKAVGVYLEHEGIKGVPKGQMVDPARVLGSRFVLTNIGGPTLSTAELKARWILGGHKDPDAGLYDTSSPTASILGHNLINFAAVQERWVVHFEDVSAAFLQGKELPRKERIYMKVPRRYPKEVIHYLVSELGDDVRDDLVELTKGGFGLPESPRLWYLEYKDTIQDLGLYEMSLLPGVFRAFHPPPGRRVRALASIHVDDTRYAGDDTAQEIWDKLRARLKSGKQRKATDGWVKFCGRWERQDPTSLEMEYSMDEYTKDIPLARVRPSPSASSASTKATSGSTSTSSSTPLSPSATSGAASTSASSTAPGGKAVTAAGSETVDDSAEFEEPIPADSDLWDYLQERVDQMPAGVEPLTDAEKKVISSIVGQLNWAARQGRYDLSYVASLVQQLAGRGRPEALKWLNLGVKRAQEPLNFKVGNLGCPLSDLVLISVSDAAYGAMPGGHSQRGNLVMVAHPGVLHGRAPVCILEGNSTKIHRVVRCSMSAEISSLATAYEHGDFVRAVMAELLDSHFEVRQWKAHVAQWKHVLATDAKTGYDAVSSETLPSDRKIAVDVAVLRQAVLEEDVGCFIRWVPGSEMPGDGLTNWGHNHVLCRVIASGEWALADNEEARELRRLAALKKSLWRKASKNVQK